jgi:hypothetical protein
VKVVRAGAPTAPAPFAATRDAALSFLAAGLSVSFLAAAGADTAFFAGAAFLATGAGFPTAGAAFFVVTVFFAFAGAAFLGATVADFFGDDAGFCAAVAAFFTTGAAFFLVGTGRFVAVSSTLAEDVLFPAREDDEVADRDAGTLLTWAPLLAGVIVPSFGPHQVAGFPDNTSSGERVTIPDRGGTGQQARHLVGGVRGREC